MLILQKLLWFLVALSVLVVVHELGHYLVARLAGVKVLRFSVGFGKTLFMRRFGRDQTEWAVCALPLGGYVKMLDEREGAVSPAEVHRSFNRATVWRRIAIVLAGPVANFLLAIALYWMLFIHGVPALKPIIDAPPPSSPAAIAGLTAGDEIIRVGNSDIQSFQDLGLALLRAGVAGQRVNIGLKDGRTAQLDTRSMQTDDLEQDILPSLGITRFNPPIPPVVGTVIGGGVAEQAGLRVGDRLLTAQGESLQSWQDWVKRVRARPGQTLEITFLRQGARMTAKLIPTPTQEGGETIGKIGAAPQIDEAIMDDLLTEVRYGPIDALWQGAKKTWTMSVFTLEMMGRMVMG